jgi:hypothetical protein
MEFKQFIESQESDIEATLAKIPKKHKALVKGYKFKFQDGNTLKGDDGHVGVTDKDKKTITICAPYFYGRENVILHEIAHQIWEKLSEKQHKKWAKIAKSTNMKKQDRQNPEELFCMAYSNEYAKHKHVVFDYPEWSKFIKSL